MQPGTPTAPPPNPPGGSPLPSDRAAKILVPWLIENRRAVLLGALLVGIVGTFFTVRLYSNLRSGLEELLPDTAPSVRAARTITNTLHNFTHLSIVFEGEDGDALARLAEDLVVRLKKLPPEMVHSIEYRIDEQRDFMQRFGGLYLSTPDLDSIQQRLDRRIAWEKKRANPLIDLIDDVDDEDEVEPAPSLDFGDIERKYGAFSSASSQFRNGYFQTPDGRLLAILVRPPQSATGLEVNKKVLDAVSREVEALQPRSYDPTIRVGYDGEVGNLVEEQAALVADLASSTVVVVVLVLSSLWFYFRRWTAILAIFGALGVGCSITFGIAYGLIGYLNANTAFLGSIVIGNGINVSIMVVARFLEERRQGLDIAKAIEIAWSGTLLPTFVASFAAGMAYLSLAFTDFKGFSQFGVIGGIGMALCWVTAFLLLPSLLASLDARSHRSLSPGRRSWLGHFVTVVNGRHGLAVRIASALLVLFSVVGVLTYRGGLIEHDLDKLRSASSSERGSGFWGQKVDRIFKAYLTPIAIRAETPGELDKVVAELDRARAAMGRSDPIREVRTLASVVPPNQEEKLPRLVHLRETLTDARLALLDPATREKAQALRPPKDLRPVTLRDLPETVRLPLVERDGTSGRIALAFPRKVGTMSAQELTEIADLVRGAIGRVGVRAEAVGQSLLFIDIARAILRDGPMATLIAFMAVVLIVAVSLRRGRPIVLVLAGLLLGVAWLVGVAAWARVRLNFLNFVVLPITFGIGVDYAVNVVQRWHAEGSDSLERVLRETGGAVGLASVTTIIGYGSLIVADSRALRGFGLFACIGEVACVTAALVALPAWLMRPRRDPGG